MMDSGILSLSRAFLIYSGRRLRRGLPLFSYLAQVFKVFLQKQKMNSQPHVQMSRVKAKTLVAIAYKLLAKSTSTTTSSTSGHTSVDST
jgi:hypothetical protein